LLLLWLVFKIKQSIHDASPFAQSFHALNFTLSLHALHTAISSLSSTSSSANSSKQSLHITVSQYMHIAT
jgi:hypothetical protein